MSPVGEDQQLPQLSLLSSCCQYIDSQIDTEVDDCQHAAVTDGDVFTNLATAMSV